ncbi:MAG: Carbon monoxide dehydrogenase medium chain [Syntrophorhabdus sp. PtaU1.Bin058]|nr:MAG: Carbon monoxide dehydrogenase medium chain [Syntrophorhabdus sp. PtaU1.Bin058]
MGIFYRRLPRFDYVVPKTLDEVLKALNKHKGAYRLLAGGTDLIPQLKKREIKEPEYVIDLKGISGLDTISYDGNGLKIGPLATITSIAQSPAVQEHYPILAQAALSMASPQVRNRGTFAGNICNAVPSADSIPSLITLSASVKIRSARKERIVPLEQFFIGPRITALKANEMVVEITVPQQRETSRGVYLKLSPRHSMDLAIVGVAVTGTCENGICKDIRIALGAVAPTPVRAPTAEAVLQGRQITSALVDEAARNAVTQCSPIDDHRASREYRCDMIYVLTRRALNQILLS